MEIQTSPSEMQDARAMAIVTMAIATQAAAEVQAAETQAAETQAAETQAAEVQAAEVQAAETQADTEVQSTKIQDWEPEFKETDAIIDAYVKAAKNARIALTAMTDAAAAVTPQMEQMRSSFDRAYEKRRQLLSRVDKNIANGYLRFESRSIIDFNANALARKKAAPGNPATPKVRPE